MEIKAPKADPPKPPSVKSEPKPDNAKLFAGPTSKNV